MSKLSNEFLEDFTQESFRIEGITHDTIERLEFDTLALHTFLEVPKLTIAALEAYVRTIEPEIRMRDQVGLNVRVGSHVPPLGGPHIRQDLDHLLTHASVSHVTYSTPYDPYHTHVQYETLHPFTDGNGRSGRAIWLWQMIKKNDYRYKLGFLHAFYYQALEASRL